MMTPPGRLTSAAVDARAAVPPLIPAKITARKRMLLCLSHLRWNFVFQRPQHLLTRAARSFDVVYWEEPELSSSLTAPQIRSEVTRSGVEVVTPLLPEGLSAGDALLAQRALLDEFLADAQPSSLIAWYYTPMALQFSGHLRPDLVVYDCMDELSAFSGAPPRLRLLERELFLRAHIVFTGGQSLYEAKRNRHFNVHAKPSSIDVAHFGKARLRQPAPADQDVIAHLRIGFFGVIDERMDLDLLAATAACEPQWNFVMIGPVTKIDPASLPRLPNIHWIGPKAYEQLPSYLAGWNAGFMPFALNDSTRFISPTKTPEFLAAGVPVVSTPITDVVRPYGRKGLVEIADTADSCATALRLIMSLPRERWLKAVDAELATNSWDRTWQSMMMLMYQAERRLGQSRARRPAEKVASHV